MRPAKSLFLLLFFLTACTPAITRDEPVSQPTQSENLVTQADIDYAENFAAFIFSEVEWKDEITLHENRVMHTWHRRDSSDLAYLDYRIYPDGYSQEDLDWYYSDENFNEILYTYYDDLEKLAECSADSLTLYEFRASYMDTPYLIRDWVDTSNPNRIADLSIIFTEADRAELNDYAQVLFPSLPSCE